MITALVCELVKKGNKLIYNNKAKLLMELCVKNEIEEKFCSCVYIKQTSRRQNSLQESLKLRCLCLNFISTRLKKKEFKDLVLGE